LDILGSDHKEEALNAQVLKQTQAEHTHLLEMVKRGIDEQGLLDKTFV
jgi:hypothetical protein